MREIKFRAWDKQEKKMSDGFTIQSIGRNDSEACVIQGGMEVGHYFYLRDCELMQFVGLKDKNGTEIYEGDILAYKTFYYGNEKDNKKIVKWETWMSDDFGEPECVGYHNVDSYMEVIGNIYENPELLKD